MLKNLFYRIKAKDLKKEKYQNSYFEEVLNSFNPEDYVKIKCEEFLDGYYFLHLKNAWETYPNSISDKMALDEEEAVNAIKSLESQIQILTNEISLIKEEASLEDIEID